MRWKQLRPFEAFEKRFAAQARFSILLAGLAGVYMLMKLNAWDRFEHSSFWWLHLMVAVWDLFALMIYVLEPLVIHRLFHEFALRDKEGAFAVATRFRAITLFVAAGAIAAGILGAQGALP